MRHGELSSSPSDMTHPLKTFDLHDLLVKTLPRRHYTTFFFPRFQEISSGRDEFTVFAEHVAIRLKNITDVRARLVAQHQINNILFEAEMGKYNMQSSFVPGNPEIIENMDEPSTSNEEKVIINNIPQTV